MKIFPWADYNHKKAAFKLHVDLDHDGLIPAFATITNGKSSEMAEVDLWKFPAGSVLVFDKGYNSYSLIGLLRPLLIFIKSVGRSSYSSNGSSKISRLNHFLVTVRMP